jgi:hypothetical protein
LFNTRVDKGLKIRDARVYKSLHVCPNSSRMASQNSFIPPENGGWDPSSGTLSPFFQEMDFSLAIKVSDTYSPAGLYNNMSAPNAQLQSVSCRDAYAPTSRGEDEDYLFVEATEDELMSLAYARPSITFSSRHAQFKKTYQAPSGGGQYFTVRDLLDIVCKCEAEDRLLYDWFGGIDAHHVFYEGAKQKPDGSWQLRWGS